MRPRWLGDKGKPEYKLKEALFFLIFLFLTFALAYKGWGATIGVENSNPGNIRSHNHKQWDGAYGLDAYGHLLFINDYKGMMGIRRVLNGYWRKHKINTASKISKRYISKQASDNERAEYAKTLCQFTHRGPNEVLDMTDPRVLMALAHGIVRHENGKVYYPESLYTRVFLGTK